MNPFKAMSCDIELREEKLNIEKLKSLMNEFKAAWECCQKGGNSTADGVCSYEWQNKVSPL